MPNQSAFIVRLAAGNIEKLQEALAADQIMIGWAEAIGLLETSLTWQQFRNVVSTTYYANNPSLHQAGNAAGHLWRFIRDMKAGDLVVVPDASSFYVAEVIGDATFDPSLVNDDSAYRRPVRWLNGERPIPRNLARSALISRMKTQGTSANATDLLDEIRDCLAQAANGSKPTLQSDLQSALIAETLRQIRSGRIDDRSFEKLIQTLLSRIGARECRIIPRQHDKGADLIATFLVGGAFELRIAVQAKHFQPEPPLDAVAVAQLIRGIAAEQADLGMVVTTGTFSESARNAAQAHVEQGGVRIELVDGEHFARLIVEHGIGLIRDNDCTAGAQ